MSNGGWPQAVAHEIGLPHPLRFKNQEGGGIIAYLECSTCPKETEWVIPKRFPPEIFRKKVQRMGWDTRKRRCPACVEAGRQTKSRYHNDPPPPNKTLKDAIEAVFQDVLPIVPQEAHMDAKISINERTVNVLIPAKSEMISLFMTDAFQPKAFWQARLVQRSKYDEAVVELTKTKLPAGALRAKGLVRGTYSSTACAFSLSWSVSGVDNHDLLGIFGATPSSLVLQSGNKLTFQVPADRKPPQRRGAINQESPQQEEPATVDQQMPEKPQDVEIPSTSPVAVPKVTLKQAIDVVNKFKDSMGEHLSLQITMQGKIRALAEYGDVSG